MKGTKGVFNNLRFFNWRLWAALSALALVPAVYQVVRTFLISTTASAAGIDVVGQMEWFDLIDETIKAFLTIPLYSILNKIFAKGRGDFPGHVFKTGLIVLLIYTVFSVIVLCYGFHLIRFMNPEEADIEAMASYLQLETAAFMVGIIPSFVNVVFVVVGKPKNVYILLGVKVILGVIADFVLVPRLGVDGIALSNILTNAVLAITGIIVLSLEGYLRPRWFHHGDGAVAKEWLKVGAFSGAQQFIDNIVYALMIGRMVNMVAEQGDYWVANNFIWGWLLIPASAMAEVIKRDTQNGYGGLRQSNYYLLSLFIFVVWAATVPAWEPFYFGLEKLENHHEIFLITAKLAPFYVAYVLSLIPDSIFVGLGKTHYNAITSVLVNFVYYGIWFGLYLGNAITFTMDVIIVMFGCGMVFHEALSLIEERVFLPKEIRRLSEKEALDESHVNDSRT
jgi:hypothetical protein